MFWDALLVLHFAATLFMLGVVATVQWLHYPLLAASHDIAAACAWHVRRAGPFIAPPMLFEAVSGLALLGSPYSDGWLAASLILLAAVWLSTFAIQVPLHRRLVAGRGGLPRLAARLVATNWLRTAAWAARAGCLVPLLLRATAGEPQS